MISEKACAPAKAGPSPWSGRSSSWDWGDTVNAIIQSMRYSVFTHPLGVNWVIVTICVPALLVSSALILWQLIGSPATASLPAATTVSP